ncbi:predicted protein [Histoplasma capsulatum G186AR]|uniref:Uncharacterized protein n=1 Tax=Ajellomyces capsulatus (strain G186AR / H82 / ATCC MYA-2454 / RMSCC 2432) TaxID=447093 RepID=C0NXE6_AJECG|nr:uncharacterized protein HCBG_08138 [Histoplasma capsulatum G186AR]EEH04012.1 predicted protein [Histoplasma capsulatum G186AR]
MRPGGTTTDWVCWRSHEKPAGHSVLRRGAKRNLASKRNRIQANAGHGPIWGIFQPRRLQLMLARFWHGLGICCRLQSSGQFILSLAVEQFSSSSTSFSRSWGFVSPFQHQLSNAAGIAEGQAVLCLLKLHP